MPFSQFRRFLDYKADPEKFMKVRQDPKQAKDELKEFMKKNVEFMKKNKEKD